VAVEQAVSMALRNRSNTPGRPPEWLRNASDLRFVGHGGNGQTELRFEIPTLESSASEIYSQQVLFDDVRPDGKLTGLDLLMNVIDEIESGQEDSTAYDSQLLKRLRRLNRFFKRGPFSEFRIVGSQAMVGKTTRFNSETCEQIDRLYGNTPKPQRVRLVGALDGIEASTLRFSLILDFGERVVGVYPEALSDQMQAFWRNRVLVVGTAIYRISGNLLRVEAEDIQAGDDESDLFSRLPTPSHAKLDSGELQRPQGPRSGMAAIMGQWPSDETEEEIEAALEQIS
jgi:hypothetical protein